MRRPLRNLRAQKERTLDIDRELFAHRLWQAIKRSGLTYRETARRAQPHLPEGLRLSDVSVWSYAKGRSVPRRLDCVAALARALQIDIAELTGTQKDASEGSERAMLVEDLGEGRARLVIDIETSWQTALAAMRLLEGGAEPSTR